MVFIFQPMDLKTPHYQHIQASQMMNGWNWGHFMKQLSQNGIILYLNMALLIQCSILNYTFIFPRTKLKKQNIS